MNTVKPIVLKNVILIFMSTCAMILFCIYVIMYALVDSGVPFFISYLFFFQLIPFIPVFGLAIYLYKKEGNPVSWQIFKERMRLKFNGKIFLWSIGLLFLGLFFYAIGQSASVMLAKIPLFAPPDWFGASIHPLKTDLSGQFMSYTVKGAYWIPLVYLIGWFLNIFGEELLFRGYLLPRMELSFGSKAWLIQGACWWIWHIFWRWQLIAIIPIMFLTTFVAQKTKSTLPGIIAHGVMNFIAIILITLGVFGIR